MSDASTQAPLAIHADELRYRYKGGVEALKGVSFKVEQGAFFALLGPNGAGKTTLAHILATLISATEGEASVAGKSVRRTARKVRQELGLVFQEPSLDDRLTVWENLDFHARLYRVPRRDARERMKALLELVELSDWSHALVRSLSRGMKRRVEIARAMMHRPAILMLDEPTVGLDVQSRQTLWAYLQTLQKEGVTLFLTTHYIEEAETADQVVIINEGEKVAEGSPAQLKADIGGDIVRLRVASELEPLLFDTWQDRASRDQDMISLRVGNAEDFFADFMPEHGANVRWSEVHRPTLEQVFVSLAGRRIADEQADAREQLLAFGKAGGEHTR